MMQSVAKFGTNAYQVSGSCDDLLQLLPDTLHIQGRIAHEQVWDYLVQLKSSTSRVCRAFSRLIIYMRKILDSDWPRAVQFRCDTNANYTAKFYIVIG